MSENEIKERVLKIIAEEFEQVVEKLTLDTKFEDIGMDSLDVIELSMVFEEEFDIELSDRQIERVVTIEDALNLVKDTVSKVS